MQKNTQHATPKVSKVLRLPRKTTFDFSASPIDTAMSQERPSMKLEAQNERFLRDFLRLCSDKIDERSYNT